VLRHTFGAPIISRDLRFSLAHEHFAFIWGAETLSLNLGGFGMLHTIF